MKLLKLTQGKFAKVDAEDFEYLNQWRWKAMQPQSRTRPHYWLAFRMAYNRKGLWRPVYLHRLIMKAPKGKVVNHKNHDALDNTKKNLEICTNQENSRYQKLRPNQNKTGYKGVSQTNKSNKFDACIGLNGKTIHLGRFENKKDAAMAYNRAAKKLYGRFALLNEL